MSKRRLHQGPRMLTSSHTKRSNQSTTHFIYHVFMMERDTRQQNDTTPRSMYLYTNKTQIRLQTKRTSCYSPANRFKANNLICLARQNRFMRTQTNPISCIKICRMERGCTGSKSNNPRIDQAFYIRLPIESKNTKAEKERTSNFLQSVKCLLSELLHLPAFRRLRFIYRKRFSFM